MQEFDEFVHVVLSKAPQNPTLNLKLAGATVRHPAIPGLIIYRHMADRQKSCASVWA